MADVRAQEVTASLREAGELGSGDHVTRLEQFVSGWSRHSFRAEAQTAGGAVRRYVVRVKPRGALLDTDLGLEYRIHRAFEDEDVPVPRACAMQEDPDGPLGGPFFVMDHVDGWAPNMYKPAERARLENDWHRERTIARDMVSNLARIHALPAERHPDGLPTQSFRDALSRWRGVYEEKRLVRDPVIEEAFVWMDEHAPADCREGLVHGDYRIGNTLVGDGHVRAVLDWELTHRGDVRTDLGYLLLERSAGKHLRSRGSLMGCFAEEEWFLERYGEGTAMTIERESLRPFEMLAIAMLLATQITATWMYKNGRTQDFRMAWARFSFSGLRQDMMRLMKW